MTSLADFETWFSAERLAPYVHAADHPDRAVRLYEWNSEVSAAFWQTLGHVEVLVRNAAHRELAAWSQRDYGTPFWYTCIDDLINERTRLDVREGRRRATRNGREETPGRVVAELNLGFWRYLLAKRYDGTLWRYCLHRAFPGQRRAVVERAIAELHLLRNRIGHHEPIHNRPLTELRELALRIANWTSPAASAWVAANDTVSSALARRP